MPPHKPAIPLEEYLAQRSSRNRELFEAVRPHVEALGEVGVRATKSQVAFWRRRPFAWTWEPAQYLKRDGLAPLVLTVDLMRRDDSPRWKQVVETHPGRFTHHLEVTAEEQLDAEVDAWLREAWREAS